MNIDDFAAAYIKLLKEHKYKLEEISMSLKDIRDKEIQCYENKMIEHLGKLFFYSNLRTYDIAGWKDEIHKFIPNVSLIKGKNKFPTKKQLDDWTINKFSDVLISRLNGLVEDLIFDGYPKLKDYDYEACKEFIISYYDKLNTILSTKGYITKQETYSILDSIK